MKVIKSFFMGIAFLIILFCVGIFVCALSPDLTSQLAGVVDNVEAVQIPVVSDNGLSIGQSGLNFP